MSFIRPYLQLILESRSQRLLSMASMSMLLVLLGLYIFLLSPQLHHSRELSVQVDSAKSELAYLRSLGSGRVQIASYKLHLDTLKEKLARPFSSAQVSSVLSKVLASSDVIVEQERYSTIRQVGGYQRLTVNLSLAGSYQALLKTLRLLDNAQYFINLSKISLDKEGDLIKGEFELEIYFSEQVASSEN
jgi:hypothetical protein